MMNLVFTVFLLCVKFKERVVLNFFGLDLTLLMVNVWDKVVMER